MTATALRDEDVRRLVSAAATKAGAALADLRDANTAGANDPLAAFVLLPLIDAAANLRADLVTLADALAARGGA